MMKEKIQRLIELSRLIAEAKRSNEDYSELIKEQKELLSDPYIYDKYYGVKHGGII